MKGFDRRQVLRFSLICGAAALVVVLVTLLIVFLNRDGGDEDSSHSRFIPEGMRLVQDIYSGELIVPDFDIPENKYDPDGFSTGEDGFTRYEGASVGIDVSEFQGEIDWYAVKAAGVEFAIIRLGYRGMTQGFLQEDSKFQQNMQGAENAAVQRGVYFFSQAVSEEEARAEADFVLETLDGARLTYPIVFDWEDPVPTEELPAETLRALDCPGETVTRCAAAFCQRIKEGGYTPCVYFNKHQGYNFYNLEELKDFDFWYAEYNSLPSICYDFRTWQYSETGTLPGIDVTVDLDICFRPY